MYKSVLLLHGYRLKFRVRLHPLLIDAIQQKFRTVSVSQEAALGGGLCAGGDGRRGLCDDRWESVKFRVRLHPLLIDAIQQKFRTVITCFIAEEHIQSDLIPPDWR